MEKIIHFKQIDSTNKYLKRHYKKGEDFTYVFAKHQLNGKGRGNRHWIDAGGKNLLFSVLLKSKKYLEIAPYLSMVSAISIYEVLNLLKVKNISLKWPNDVYVGNKKICGILLESSLPEYVVIGIGLNVNQHVFLGEYRTEPTSIYLETGNKINLNELENMVMDILNHDIEIATKTVEGYLALFNEKNYLKDKAVSFKYNDETIRGVVKNINDDFSVSISNTKHGVLKINSGELSLIP